MSAARFRPVIGFFQPLRRTFLCHTLRHATTTETGAILPEPRRIPFGLAGIVCTVITGLMVGALISQKIANFLEENDLFVPSDDDDDDD